MKNYKNIIVGSFLVMAIVASPAISFAKEKENERREDKQEQKQERSSWFSSWFNNKSKNNVSTIPTVSNVIVSSTKSTKAVVSWSTNIRSNSMVWYSTSPSVDTSRTPNMKRNDRTLKHKFEIKKLQPNTTYYIVVGGATTGGVGKGAEISFTTGAGVKSETVPVITSVTGPATVKLGDAATFTLVASDPQNKALTYGVEWGDDSKLSQTSFTGSVTVSHTYSNAGTYVAKFTVVNSDGKKATYPMKVTVAGTDTLAPVISNVTTSVCGTSATVSWKRSEASNSTVFYGTGTPIDTNNAATLRVTDSSMVTNHSISIPGLTSSTLYHFVIKSADGSNNVASSTEAAFTTN